MTTSLWVKHITTPVSEKLLRHISLRRSTQGRGEGIMTPPTQTRKPIVYAAHPYKDFKLSL